jgi:hypothetical protein
MLHLKGRIDLVDGDEKGNALSLVFYIYASFHTIIFEITKLIIILS